MLIKLGIGVLIFLVLQRIFLSVGRVLRELRAQTLLNARIALKLGVAAKDVNKILVDAHTTMFNAESTQIEEDKVLGEQVS